MRTDYLQAVRVPAMTCKQMKQKMHNDDTHKKKHKINL